MSKYLAKIGLEMHCEISETNSKVFSSAKNDYSQIPNSNIRPVDMAFPGILPVVNKEAVRMALMTSMVLNCSQPEYMYFERKNYYYPDLPKGFQLTQETKPIPVGIYGHVEYECNGEEKSVRVNNLHLEEDAASSEHLFDTTTIDYNRAGVPLLELVTEPDFHSSDEAVAFLEHMRSVYQYLDISEADSKKGQLRCDVNVSIMDPDKDENDPNNWGTKVEIKNVNSFGGVRDAINYEIKRQSHLKDNGEYDKVVQETRRWDEESGTTISMRSKVDAVDYKYFVEPNIPKFKLSKEWLDEIRESIPMLAYDRKKKYMNEYLPEDIAILQVEQVDGRFHSRLNAKSKTYEYRIYKGSKPDVFERRYVWPMEEKLDVAKIREAAKYLTGTHDFMAFCGNRRMKKTTVRTIYQIEIEETEHEIRMRFTGSGFLQNMVRILTGTLVEVGRGERTPEDMERILESRDRQQAGFLMPAKGLTLMEVKYK
mgnify:CR=1 FL=1